MLEQSKQFLINLLISGETKSLINQLLSTNEVIKNETLYEEIVLQSAQFETFSRSNRAGLLDNNDIHIRLARINSSLLELLNKLPDKIYIIEESRLTEYLPNNIKEEQLLSSEPDTKETTLLSEIKKLLELNGYECKLNYSIDGIKLDLLGKFQSGIIKQEYAIKCIYEDTINEENVEKLIYISKKIKEKSKNINLLVISKSKLSDNISNYLTDSGIEVINISYLVSNLLNFENYLKKLVEEWESNEISRYYIPIEIISDSIDNEKLENFVDKFIRNNNNTAIAILGEYGTGKSTFSRYYSYKCAKRHMQKNKTTEYFRIPIVFNLSDFNKEINIESLIVNHLDRVCQVNNPKYSIFEKMNKEGLFLLIFDGFDEMAVKTSYDVLLKNISQIQKLSIPSKSKLILTSRPEYFKNIEEEEKILESNNIKLINYKTLTSIRNSKFAKINLSLFNENQISAFIKKRLESLDIKSSELKQYVEIIDNIYDLKSLSKRPVLLDMIIQTLPILVKTNLQYSISINLLYKTFLNNEIERQIVDKNRDMLIESSDRFAIMESLSLEIFSIDRQEFSGEDIALTGNKYFDNINKKEIEYFIRDFLNCSFLTRTGDLFKYSHKSIYEYLVAKSLSIKILNDDIAIFARKPISSEILYFIAEEYLNKSNMSKIDLKKVVNILVSWILLTKAGVDKETRYLGRNSLMLVNLLLKGNLFNLHTYLDDQDGVFIDFSEVDIQHTFLKNSIIYGIGFSNANTEGVVFNACKMDYTSLSSISDEVRKNSTIISEDEIIAYTPNGSPIVFPNGATALDFAFDIHTDLGLHTRDIIVNNHIVPFNYELKHGDAVQIKTMKNVNASIDWINNVRTAKARETIAKYFRKSKNQ